MYDNSAAYASVYVIFGFKGILAELQMIPENGQHDDESRLKKRICHTIYEIIRGKHTLFATLAALIGDKEYTDDIINYRRYDVDSELGNPYRVPR